ncbi:hypothetical protein HX021_07200 [Sphingobacterium sp. N143]|uniref:hypothetical protein n=1 Tax=Sphingobacterium sp. N143 TaxID=2746727 RepID=UPI002577C18D|nr:hypothetical protein [Sphingobacterium sp. N143]MDM1294081.1 hypothetical protein [Sphingobacterium sp. N143]
MRKTQAIFLFVATFAVLFTSCKKDDPVHEHDNEEIQSIKFTFTDENSKEQVELSVNATDSKEKELILKKGGDYKLLINMYDFEGHEVTQEIKDDAEDHQFFFVGPTSDQVKFTYLDAQIGLASRWEIKQQAPAKPMNVVLMHGLNKQKVSPENWNSINYESLGGGTKDINVNVILTLKD